MNCRKRPVLAFSLCTAVCLKRCKFLSPVPHYTHTRHGLWFAFRWEGVGLQEVGKDKKTGTVRVRVNPKFFRPTEVVSTCNRFVLRNFFRRKITFKHQQTKRTCWFVFLTHRCHERGCISQHPFVIESTEVPGHFLSWPISQQICVQLWHLTLLFPFSKNRVDFFLPLNLWFFLAWKGTSSLSNWGRERCGDYPPSVAAAARSPNCGDQLAPHSHSTRSAQIFTTLPEISLVSICRLFSYSLRESTTSRVLRGVSCLFPFHYIQLREWLAVQSAVLTVQIFGFNQPIELERSCQLMFGDNNLILYTTKSIWSTPIDFDGDCLQIDSTVRHVNQQGHSAISSKVDDVTFDRWQNVTSYSYLARSSGLSAAVPQRCCFPMRSASTSCCLQKSPHNLFACEKWNLFGDTMFRCCPQDFLQGDCTKAKTLLKWQPKYDFSVSTWWTVLRGGQFCACLQLPFYSWPTDGA